MEIQRITDKSQLKAGFLYCCFETRDDFKGGSWECDGELVYFGNDGRFYDADSGEQCSPDYDYLVEQSGVYDAEYAELAA